MKNGKNSLMGGVLSIVSILAARNDVRAQCPNPTLSPLPFRHLFEMTPPRQMILPVGMSVNAPGAIALSSTNGVLVADSNGDFMPDIITGSRGAGGVGVHVWHATPRAAGDVVVSLPTPAPLAWGHYSQVDRTALSTPSANLLDMVRSGSILDMAFFDGDGDGVALDVVVSTDGTQPVAWLRHAANGDLVTEAMFPTNLVPVGGQPIDPNNPWCILQVGMCAGRLEGVMVEAEDLDGDGDDDIVFAGSLNPGAPNLAGGFHILIHDLDVASGVSDWRELRLPPAQIATLSARAAAGLHLFDAGLDGDTDILLVQAGIDLLLVNDGTGAFTDVALGVNSIQVGPADCDSVDIDNDGNEDLLIVSQVAAAPVAWYENLNGTPGVMQYAARANLPVTNLPPFLPNGYNPAMAVGDVNEDCTLDIVFGPAFPNLASRVWLGSSPATGWTMDDQTSFYIGRDTTTPPDGCFDASDDFVPGAPPVVSRPRTASLFDIDLDSDLDFVFGTDTSGVTIYTNSARCLDSPPQISMASVDLTTGQPCSAAQAEWRYRASNWANPAGLLGVWIDFGPPGPVAPVGLGFDPCGNSALSYLWLNSYAFPLQYGSAAAVYVQAPACAPPLIALTFTDVEGMLPLPNPVGVSGGLPYRIYSQVVYASQFVSYFRTSAVNLCEVTQ